MLQTMLGLQTDAHEGRVRISPRLPEWMGSVRVSNLRVGNKRMDLRVERRDGREQAFLDGEGSGITLEIM
jgi:cellobiose phosphorylase